MAIPEFILKKLIVPGSFQSTPDGYQFALLDSFAPATVSSFKVMVGNELVPDKEVTISSQELTGFTADQINAQNPMPLVMGVEMLIRVITSTRSENVKVIVETKEMGELTFSISESKNRQYNQELKPGLLDFLKPPRKATLGILADQVIGTASPFLAGHFIEHLERCIYGGIWTDDGSELRKDTLDLIKQLNPSIMRYPGGNFASGYHWEDGIGSKSSRPIRHDAAWQAAESNQVGTDEFLAFCREVNTEPLLVVNDGSGTADEAARWVAYCNSPVETEQGQRRAANGHPEPYNVKYWGVGNEVWGPWQIGTTSAEEYTRRLLRFIQAMKAVDPTIKIVAVGNLPLNDDPENPARLWNRVVLQAAASEIDYLSWHIYQPDKESWRESYDPAELFKSVCAASIDMDNIIKRVEAEISEFSPDKHILQAIDEWNVWLPPSAKSLSMHRVTYTMRDALYVASVLATFYRNCNTTGMTNLAQMVNVLPLIETNDTAAIATAIFHPFVLFTQMGNSVLKAEIDSETFDSLELDASVQAHSAVPYLDALATSNDENQVVSVLLINRYPFEKLEVSVHFADGKSYIPVSSLELSAKLPGSYNSFQNPTAVTIRDGKLPVFKDGVWKSQLKPASVRLVEFKLK